MPIRYKTKQTTQNFYTLKVITLHLHSGISKQNEKYRKFVYLYCTKTSGTKLSVQYDIRHSATNEITQCNKYILCVMANTLFDC